MTDELEVPLGPAIGPVVAAGPMAGTGWSREEVAVDVSAYADMLDTERADRPYTKARFREAALQSELAGRPGAAFERRTGNISHIRLQAGLDRIQGYRRYSSVGGRISDQLCLLIGEDDPEALRLISSPEPEVAMERAARPAFRLDVGGIAPGQPGTVRNRADRQGLRALNGGRSLGARQAGGVCERCGQLAPFHPPRGEPFLGVHQIVLFSAGGPDVVANLAAICPNCHLGRGTRRPQPRSRNHRRPCGGAKERRGRTLTREAKGAAECGWASSPGTRRSMQSNKGRDTLPELRVRSAVHKLGLRYRVNQRPLPGLRRTADLVFRKARVAVFIDGCFWHRCPIHYTRPVTNTTFWTEKVQQNVERDLDTDASLRAAGWVVLRFWEHEDPSVVADAIHCHVVGQRASATAASSRGQMATSQSMHPPRP